MNSRDDKPDNADACDMANVSFEHLSADDVATLERELVRQIRRVEARLRYSKALLRSIRRHRNIAKGNLPVITRKGFVYAMFDDRTLLVKVGFASDPEKRRKNIQTATGGTLRFVGLIAADPPDEYKIHRLFGPDRVKGEWFRASESLLEHFEQNTDATESALCEPKTVRRVLVERICARSAYSDKAHTTAPL